KLPPTIHFAGTNGKGSTLNFLYQILKNNNQQIHCYTSPHLVDFNERIIIANKQISDKFLNQCLEECQEKSEIDPKIPVTFFEGITIAAFLAFSQVKANFLLLETGMGGRLDATNVLEQVLASIITPISLDHTEFLGNSIQEIAFEKAGIIKKNCPTIIGRQTPEALKVLKEQAKIHNSKTIILNEDFRNEKHQNYFNLINNTSTLAIPNPKMLGSHQIDNLSLAITTYMSIIPIKNDSQQSFKNLDIWPARLQQIYDTNLYIDGSHNEEGAKTVLEFLKFKQNSKRIIIYSTLQDKDYPNFLKIIANEIDELIITVIPNEPKSEMPTKIQKIAQKLNINNKIMDTISITNLINAKDKNTTTLITGSLYSAGYYLNQIFQKSNNN
ncbi:MAG: bifunctional folylpolyglutamate synthase/dihydrofolate synthase, partial [Rickettsiales bacterium]|nr:bifunctional folylpolyglutamate synthase/dihydrofolate synthase [Rickettsiales bacterium]